MVRIIEIDDNNDTSTCFKNNTDFEMVSISTKDGDEAFQDAIIKSFQSQDDFYLGIDSGGGLDSRKVLEIIKDNELEDDFLYIIPVMNSLSSAKNAIDTYKLVNDHKNTLFVLNNVYNPSEIEKEFLFFFGSKDFGLDSLYEALKKPAIAIIEHTPLFEIAALNGVTIKQLGDISKSFEATGKNKNEILFEKSGGDSEKFKQLDNQYKQSKKCNEYLSRNLDQLKKIIQKSGKKKVCICSTKGGVGKSTIAFHILPLCFN
ncbi:MAG: hypothetical protein WC694_03490 [Candidatus Paceibacterota bacterium]|jgi:hypothetical protein